MKPLALLLLLALMSGCVSHDLPKNAYMKGVKSELSTPWGSHKLDIEEAATGTAASNVSKRTQ